MKTLSIAISDFEYNQLGIQKVSLTFSELLDVINRELSKQALNKCIELADKYNLSKMSNDEIENEIKATRDAKNYN